MSLSATRDQISNLKSQIPNSTFNHSPETEDAMIQELEDVVLECDLPEHDLRRGDIGTVVLIQRDLEAYPNRLLCSSFWPQLRLQVPV
jgi:hypothetical protein